MILRKKSQLKHGIEKQDELIRKVKSCKSFTNLYEMIYKDDHGMKDDLHDLHDDGIVEDDVSKSIKKIKSRANEYYVCCHQIILMLSIIVSAIVIIKIVMNL